MQGLWVRYGARVLEVVDFFQGLNGPAFSLWDSELGSIAPALIRDAIPLTVAARQVKAIAASYHGPYAEHGKKGF